MNSRWSDFILIFIVLFVIAAWAVFHGTGNEYLKCISSGDNTVGECVELTK